jgi:hypothetical protein
VRGAFRWRKPVSNSQLSACFVRQNQDATRIPHLDQTWPDAHISIGKGEMHGLLHFKAATQLLMAKAQTISCDLIRETITVRFSSSFSGRRHFACEFGCFPAAAMRQPGLGIHGIQSTVSSRARLVAPVVLVHRVSTGRRSIAATFVAASGHG